MISLTNVDSSTVSWIELLPIGWQLTRLKWTTNQIKNGIWGDEPKKSDDDVICVRVADFDRIAFRVILDKPTLRNVPHSQQHGRLLKSGDLLIEKSGGGELQPVGTVVIYDRHDPAVCSNFIARVEIRDGYDPRFLTYLHAHLYAIRVNTRSIKQTTGIQNLDSQSYFDEFVGIPPWQTQKSIAHFLDRKTAAIDTLIAKKQRLIQLLEEKRTALINQAVTKGLNPNAPMKDSGIPWIGEIPEHWEVKRLKFVMSHTVDCLHSTPTYEKDGQYPAIRTADISPGELNIADANRVNGSDYLERIQRLKPQVNDIIYSREGERYGMAALVPPDIDLCLAQRVMMFRVHNQHSPHYIMWALNASCTYHQIRQDTVGATSPRVNIETIKEAWLPISPHNEQVLISKKIFTSFEIIRTLTSAIERHIEKLQEYRRSLITAAVTGKLEISEVEADV